MLSLVLFSTMFYVLVSNLVVCEISKFSSFKLHMLVSDLPPACQIKLIFIFLRSEKIGCTTEMPAKDMTANHMPGMTCRDRDAAIEMPGD